MLDALVEPDIDRNITLIAFSGDLTEPAQHQIRATIGKAIIDAPLTIVAGFTQMANVTDVPHFSELIWPPTRQVMVGRCVLAGG